MLIVNYILVPRYTHRDLAALETRMFWKCYINNYNNSIGTKNSWDRSKRFLNAENFRCNCSYQFIINIPAQKGFTSFYNGTEWQTQTNSSFITVIFHWVQQEKSTFWMDDVTRLAGMLMRVRYEGEQWTESVTAIDTHSPATTATASDHGSLLDTISWLDNSWSK